MALSLPSNVVKTRDLMLKHDSNFKRLVSNGIKTMNNVIELTETIATYTAMAMFGSDIPYKNINDIPPEDAKLISNYCGSANIPIWEVDDFPKTETGAIDSIFTRVYNRKYAIYSIFTLEYAIKQVYLEKFFKTINEMEDQAGIPREVL